MIRLSQVYKHYQDGEAVVEVLSGVDLEVGPGEFVCILGPSGSGKSTLLNLVGGLDTEYRGTVSVDGRDLSTLDDAGYSQLRSTTVAFVFQAFHLLPITALENVLVPTWFVRGREPSDRDTRARWLLERVGLGDKMRRTPDRLSGGERQRVAIARALVNAPKVLLADEPTGNLDQRTGDEIAALFAELAEGGLSILMVTHETRLCRHAHRTVRLEGGALREVTEAFA